MRAVRPITRRLAVVIGLTGWAVGTACFAAWMPPPEQIVAAVEAQELASPRKMGIRLFRTVERGDLTGPVVIPFAVRAAAPFDRNVPVTVVDERIAKPEGSAQILAGQTLGYAVLKGVGAGQTEARIGPEAVELHVSDRSGPLNGPRLSITAPADGAGAWGVIGVGAAWWRPGAETDAVPMLSIGGREPIAPKWVSPTSRGPLGLACFEVDLAALPDGPCDLRITLAGSDDVASVQVHVLHPESADLLTGECEAEYELPPLPENRRERKPSIGKDKEASGGRYFGNSGSAPRFRFPVQVPEGQPSWYQVMVRAGCDSAAGAMAGVGIVIDEGQRPRTASALACESWHRVPVGRPIRLDPGSHVIRVDFLNDFNVGGAADRNLRLDAIEVARISGGRGESPGGQSGEATTAMMSAGGASAASGEMAMMEGGGGMMGMGGGGGSAASDGWEWPASAGYASRSPLRVAVASPEDNAEIAGDFEIRGVVRWPGMGERSIGTAAPRTSLLLNGETLDWQFSAAPRFVVAWEALRPGENTVQLVCSAPGTVENRTPEVRVFRPGIAPDDSASSAARVRLHRFTVHDPAPAWNDGAGKLLTTANNPPERAAFGLYSDGDVTLCLPPEIVGEFEIDVDARGEAFDGPPVVKAVLLSGACEAEWCGEEVELGAASVTGNWASYTVKSDEKGRVAATAALDQGPKFLRLSFINDKYEPKSDKSKGGDRNVFIQGVTLRAIDRDTSAMEPCVASVLYPATGAVVRANGADAAVLRFSGPVAPARAVVELDRQPIGLPIDLDGAAGPYLLPVSLRGVAEGDHELRIRVTDRAGREQVTETRRVQAVAPNGTNGGTASPRSTEAVVQLTDYERAVVMTDRFGFGPDARELAAALLAGPEGYLRARLSEEAGAPGVATARAVSRMRYSNSGSSNDVARRAIAEALETPNPVRTRFVQWTENHFSTWLRKTEARRKADEHNRFDLLGVARFQDLLLASATSPAMLVYLDQAQSYARRLNENYAREIMELHTLGVHGGYTQEDVTNLARLLTGWTLAREPAGSGPESADAEDGMMSASVDDYGMVDGYRYDPALGDDKIRTFLGREFAAADGERRLQRPLVAIGMLAGHPATARFIGRKIAEHYIGFPAPDASAEALASVFERTGGDMREVLMEIPRRPEFWASAGRTSHPPEFAFRLARCARSGDAPGVHEHLNLSGHGMFDRSTPDGYQENDDEVMDSNAMLQRWKFARRLERPLADLLPGEMRRGSADYTEAELQQAVDLVAMRLTGRLLGESSNAAALGLMAQTSGRREDRARVLGVFIASTPEVQVK